MKVSKSLKVKDILDNYNVEGEIYRSDIKEFFGWELPKEKIEDLHGALMEIRDAN